MADLKDMMLSDDDLDVVNGGMAMDDDKVVSALMQGKANATSMTQAVLKDTADSTKNILLGGVKKNSSQKTKPANAPKTLISGGVDLNNMC